MPLLDHPSVDFIALDIEVSDGFLCSDCAKDAKKNFVDIVQPKLALNFDINSLEIPNKQLITFTDE